MKRRNKILLFALVLLLAGCVALERANRVPPVTVPSGVKKERVSVTLQSKAVTVDVYRPAEVKNAPLVILVHGFMRDRRMMAGWGVKLAQEGYIAAAMNTPFFSQHVKNAEAVEELVNLARMGGLIKGWQSERGLALMGHSAGGFSTLLATAKVNPNLWVGLDPVDFLDKGRAAAPDILSPGVALLAEPGAWNRQGNAKGYIAAYAGPLVALRIKGSTHCDPEDPSTKAAEWACGERDADRRALYQKLVLTALQAHLRKDEDARSRLEHPDDPSKIEVLRADKANDKSLATPAG